MRLLREMNALYREEKVLALQARKPELSANVVDGGNAFGGGLSADDIRGLFA